MITIITGKINSTQQKFASFYWCLWIFFIIPTSKPIIIIFPLNIWFVTFVIYLSTLFNLSFAILFHKTFQPFLLLEGLFFSIWVFFQEHSRITGLQGKGDGISLTSQYHFHLLHRHLDITAGQLLQRAHLCS